MPTVRFVLPVALGVVIGTTARAPRPLVVGALENPCWHAGSDVVRPLFTKAGAKWIAIDGRKVFDATITPEMSWTIAFDGTNLGTVRTIDPKQDIKYEWTFVRDRLLMPAPGQTLPKKPNRAHRFDRVCSYTPDRPLVLVTQPNVADPDAWKPIAPTAGMRDSLFGPFHALVDSVWICPNGEDNPGRLLNYHARDLVVDAAYRNKRGEVIVGVYVNRRYMSCGAPAADEWDTHWYLMSDKPTYLGSGLALVDAGDYDADGRSELLFAFTSGGNHDGYTLFADDFRTRVDLRWTYH